MANGNAGIYFCLAFLGGLADSRVLIFERPEGEEDFIAYGRPEMLDEFRRFLDKGNYRDIEMESRATVKGEQALLQALERIDRKIQEAKENAKVAKITRP